MSWPWASEMSCCDIGPQSALASFSCRGSADDGGGLETSVVDAVTREAVTLEEVMGSSLGKGQID